MRILGLDIAGSTGYAVLDSTKSKLLEAGKICLVPRKNTEYRERLYILCTELNSLLNKYSPEVVAIEELHSVRNGKTTILLGMYLGATISCIPKEIQVTTVHAVSARYNLLGRLYKKVGKEEVFNWAVGQFKLKKLNFKEDNDITDAILIAYHQAMLTKCV